MVSWLKSVRGSRVRMPCCALIHAARGACAFARAPGIPFDRPLFSRREYASLARPYLFRGFLSHHSKRRKRGEVDDYAGRRPFPPSTGLAERTADGAAADQANPNWDPNLSSMRARKALQGRTFPIEPRTSQRVVPATLCALAIATLLSSSGRAAAADPTTSECLTANESSIALSHSGQLRAALAQMIVCAGATCPADVKAECLRRIAEVDIAMPTIAFEVKDAAGNDAAASKVTMDGEALSDWLEGTAISLDPGVHVFVFEAAGLPPLTKRMVIRQGEKDRREVVQLLSPTPAPGALLPPSSPTDRPVPPSPTTPPSQGIGMQRVLALVAGGLGVAGVAVGTVFGLDSKSKHDDAVHACPAACASQSGVTLWNQARSAGDLSTVGFVVGAVGLAGGAVLWFTARSSEESTVHVGLGPGTLQVRAVW